MDPNKKTTLPSEKYFAGIHLSGPNNAKTTMTILKQSSWDKPLIISKLYEKIGPLGSLFSDDRLVDIIKSGPELSGVFVDCPLSVPPCVRCTRETCPGVVKCEEVPVAIMLNIDEEVRTPRNKRGRPINPQSQRLWDVMNLNISENRNEPSYSANLAPLVARAKTFEKRLKCVSPELELKETSLPHVLEILENVIGYRSSLQKDYRSFEKGRETRQMLMEEFVERGWIDNDLEEIFLEQIAANLENFQSFLTAWVCSLSHLGLVYERPEGFDADEGWVFLPKIVSSFTPKLYKW